MCLKVMEKHSKSFCSAFVNEDTEKIEQIYGEYLWNTISIRDTAVANMPGMEIWMLHVPKL